MTSPKYLDSVARLATLLEPSRRNLFEYVNDQPGAVSRDEAADRVGVSRAMAAFHLDRLVESGLLRAEYRRLAPGRAGRGTGRPSKLYRRSRHRFDVTVPSRAYEVLARLLAETLDPKRADATPRQVGEDFGRSLGVRARARLAEHPTRRRLTACVTDALADFGFEPVSGSSAASSETRSRNCPFDPISRQLPDVVCQVALGIVGGLVEGTGADHLVVGRSPRPGLCCIVLATHQPIRERRTKTAMGMR